MLKCTETRCANQFGDICGCYTIKPEDKVGNCTAFWALKPWIKYEFNIGDKAKVRAWGSNKGKVVEIVGKELRRQPDEYRYLAKFDSGVVLDYYGDELEPYSDG